MTRTVNARIAGVAYLLYFAAGIAAMALRGRPHAPDLLALLTSFAALALGVTLYAITRDQDPDIALLGLTCRVIEAIPGQEGVIFFAVATLLFSWLMLRGRMIPLPLAWLGVVASSLLVILLPLQKAGLFGGTMSWSSPITWVVYLPAAVFELALAAWFLTKGVAAPSAPIPNSTPASSLQPSGPDA